MIFLTVGSWHKGFDRLVRAVDELKENKTITDDVVGQIGPGSYRPKYFQYRDFFSQEEFMDHVARSRFIISHAGMGTIGQAIHLSKPVIVVPRNPSLGEHVDDHQFATTKYMEAEGKVLAAYDIDQLREKIRVAAAFVPAKGHGPEEILKTVGEYIKSLAARYQ